MPALPLSRSTLCALSLALSAAALGCGRPADAASPERARVAATVQLYFKAHATGQGDYIRQAFHPDAHVFSVKEGALAAMTRDEFAGRFSGKPAADEARRARRILSIDVSGNSAVAKVELDYPDAHIIDYLSLLRLDGSWVVLNKVFHRDAKREGSERSGSQKTAPAAPGPR